MTDRERAVFIINQIFEAKVIEAEFAQEIKIVEAALKEVRADSGKMIEEIHKQLEFYKAATNAALRQRDETMALLKAGEADARLNSL